MAVYYALCRASCDQFQQNGYKNTAEHQNGQDRTVKASVQCSSADTCHHQRTAETAAAQRVLARLLYRCFGVSMHAHHILRSSGEKPYFEDLPYHFSITHSGGWVACAVGREPCGIDVQADLPKSASARLHAIARRWFSEQDYQRFLQGENFYSLWCENEAYLKFIGTGLRTPMRQLEKKNGCVYVPNREPGVLHRCRTPVSSLHLCLCLPLQVQGFYVNLPRDAATQTQRISL